MIRKPLQKKSFRSFEDYLVKQYPSKKGKIDVKMSEKNVQVIKKVFFKDWNNVVPKSIEIYHSKRILV